ncbi:MAG: hypothetical protein J6J03_07885, partial [Tyzzerella sp.]|nr:hypothetical protein [Tyzzerella sp.]
MQKKEWESVYEETLQLVKAFPLADKRKVNCRGINTICLVPTEEREECYGWNHEKKRTVWRVVGDYETMHTAEEYSLKRELIEDEDIETDAGDALLGVLPAYLNYDWEDPLCSHIYEIWGAKTQGEPYHIYLLAIACLIESRLKNKAFVYGDITKGQCKHAVALANKYLKEPIDIPDRCDMERLWKRIMNLPLSKREQIKAFERFYLGMKGAEFGDSVRNLCSKTVWDEYWREEFKNVSIGTYGFDEMIKKYLLWGFSLEELCSFVDYNDEKNNPQYDKFVKIIMDSKLHLQEKNCDDILEIDQDESQPYSIYTLMAQFAFMGARNKKVDRYIPIEDIRAALKRGMPECSNIDLMIDEYLEKETSVVTEAEGEKSEEDASEVFREFM